MSTENRHDNRMGHTQAWQLLKTGQLPQQSICCLVQLHMTLALKLTEVSTKSDGINAQHNHTGDQQKAHKGKYSSYENYVLFARESM